MRPALPFDLRLALHCFGVRFTVRMSTVVIVTFALAGVLSRVAGDEPLTFSLLSWCAIGAIVWAAVVLVLVGHEALRIWVSHRLGVRVRRLDLYTFGGLPHTIEETTSPRTEAVAGIAGLLMLVIAAAILGAAAFATRDQSALVHLPIRVVALAAIGLGLVHLLPAPPLDGGRILRAWLWYLTDDKIIGTRAVAIYAQVIGIGLVMTAVLLLTQDRAWPFWGIWLAVAGWQIAGAARSVLHRSLWHFQGHDVTLAQIVASSPHRLPASLTLDGAVDVLLDTDAQTAFLVTENNLPVGVFTMRQLRQVPRNAWETSRLRDVMIPLAALPALAADTALNDAIARLDEEERHLVLVLENGAPIAVVTIDEIVHHLVGHPR